MRFPSGDCRKASSFQVPVGNSWEADGLHKTQQLVAFCGVRLVEQHDLNSAGIQLMLLLGKLPSFPETSRWKKQGALARATPAGAVRHVRQSRRLPYVQWAFLPCSRFHQQQGWRNRNFPRLKLRAADSSGPIAAAAHSLRGSSGSAVPGGACHCQ